MTLIGHIIGGQIVLDVPAALPDGTVVRVHLAGVTGEELASNPPPEATSALSDRLKSFLGHVVDLPEDAAENHDHYLYGAPKR
jgi:hypothetical protein